MKGRMDGISAYIGDMLASSDQRTSALHSRMGQHNLPNQLDRTGVVEEIEGVDRSGSMRPRA
jgi:hypothetical protein